MIYKFYHENLSLYKLNYIKECNDVIIISLFILLKHIKRGFYNDIIHRSTFFNVGDMIYMMVTDHYDVGVYCTVM